MVEPKTELLPILEQIEREKGIKKEGILKLIESALVSAYRKHVGKNVKFEATIVPETAEVKAYVFRTIVEKTTNPSFEIPLKEAKNIDPNAVLGGEVKLPVDTQEFSRIAAQTAKQVIIQKIRESERSSLFEEFKAKEGAVLSGVVYRFMNNNIILDIGKVEAIMPVREQVFRERFQVGDHIRVLIASVDLGPKGIRVVASRARPELVKKLFELEVPEIYEKVVEIKSIVREPGIRTKMIVISHNPRVDPVGTCVGVKGSRVKPIIDELRGEHIDLIPYSEDKAKLIAHAFSPAKVLSVTVDEAHNRANVMFTDDMLAIAIGKHGSNVNLVSRLVGMQIDVKSEKQKQEEATKKTADSVEKLVQLESVGPKLADLLVKSGLGDINKLAQAKVEDLTIVQSVGEKTAQKIIDSAKKILKDKEQEQEKKPEAEPGPEPEKETKPRQKKKEEKKEEEQEQEPEKEAEPEAEKEVKPRQKKKEENKEKEEEQEKEKEETAEQGEKQNEENKEEQSI